MWGKVSQNMQKRWTVNGSESFYLGYFKKIIYIYLADWVLVMEPEIFSCGMQDPAP